MKNQQLCLNISFLNTHPLCCCKLIRLQKKMKLYIDHKIYDVRNRVFKIMEFQIDDYCPRC